MTTHCSQIESCGVFLVNGDTLAQINLDHVSNFKEVKGGPTTSYCEKYSQLLELNFGLMVIGDKFEVFVTFFIILVTSMPLTKS